MLFLYHLLHYSCVRFIIFDNFRLLQDLVLIANYDFQDVILIATRRILRPPQKGSAVQRPRSRTLTAVHAAMLEDVVVPAEIVAKRVRYRIDGSKIMKVCFQLSLRLSCLLDSSVITLLEEGRLGFQIGASQQKPFLSYYYLWFENRRIIFTS